VEIIYRKRKMTYTKEEKQAYFKNLRESWKKSKALADNDQVAKAIYNEVGGNFSYYSFYFTLTEMKNLGYDGLPYIDCKTYKGWRDAGFIVRKGEQSKLNGITWLEVGDKEAGETDYVIPKLYHLFHKSQVEELK